jgi:hypothetical protein
MKAQFELKKLVVFLLLATLFCGMLPPLLNFVPLVHASSTTYFADGFECPPNSAPSSFSAWSGVVTSGANITIVTDHPHTGNYCAKVDLSAGGPSGRMAFCYENVSSTLSSLNVTMWVYWESGLVDSVNFPYESMVLGFCTDLTYNWLCAGIYNSSGTLYWALASEPVGGWTPSISSIEVTKQEWQRITVILNSSGCALYVGNTFAVAHSTAGLPAGLPSSLPIIKVGNMWSSEETDVFYIDDVTIGSGQLPPSTSSPPYLSGPTYSYNQTDGTYNSVEWHLWYPQSYPNSPPLIIASPGIGDVISDIPYSEIVPYGYAVLGFSGSDSFANWSVCISNYSAALTTLIDWVFSSSFPYLVDKNNVGLYGFSCGGGAVLTINDTRIHAIVADCPAYVTGICAKNKVPVLITTANGDIECPYSTNGYLYYSALSTPKMIIQIAGGTHQNDAGMNYSLSWYYWLLKSQTSGLNYINNVNTNPNIVVWETTLPLVAPTVTATPAAVNQGQSSNLTSTPMTSGVPPYSYQWFEKGLSDLSYSLISGANLSSYDFATSGATATGAWSFVLQVTDYTGAVVNSTAVSVTVLAVAHAKRNLTVTVSGQGSTNATGTYAYDEYTNVTVSATPNPGWNLDQWKLNGSSAGSKNPYTINMTDNFNLTAVFTQIQYDLFVGVVGHGVTNVTGTNTYPSFTDVPVLATPDSGYYLLEWLLNGISVGSANPYTVSMINNYNLTAVFAPIQFTLTVNVSGQGSTNATGTFTHGAFTNVTVLATPGSGYFFDHWILNISNAGSVNPYTINMTANYNLIAVFTPVQVTLTVQVSGQGVTNATGTFPHNQFTNVTVLATPDAGYFFDHWLLNTTSAGSVNPYTINMTANFNLTAVFSAVQRTLTVIVVGQGSTNVTGTHSYNEFTNVTVLATPSSGYFLDHWILNNTGAGSKNPYTINMTANYDLTAVFTPIQYNLTVTVSGQGSTNATGTFTHDAFTNVTVLATPDSGYVLEYWTLNGSSVGSVNPYTINMTANYNLIAVFTPVQVTLTVQVSGQGVTNATGTFPHNQFTNVTVLATPDAGYFFDHWLLNTTSAGSVNPYTINMTANYDLTAVFSAVQRTLTVSVLGQGSTNVTGTHTYDEYTNVTVLATPDSGWKLDQWTLNGTVYGPTSSFTVNMTVNYDLVAVFKPLSSFLVVRGEDDRIYYRLYNSTSMSWESWEVLPSGWTPSSPAATMCSNSLYIAVQGEDNQSIYFSYINLTNNSFSGWTKLTGETPSAPTLTSNGTTLCLVVRGENNRIYYRFYNIASQTWTGWEVLPSGWTLDSPAAAIQANQLHIVVRGMDGTSIWDCSLNLTTNVYSGWELVGGETPSAPSCT